MAAKVVKKQRKVRLTPEEAKIYKKRARLVHLRHQVVFFFGLMGITIGLILSLLTTHSIMGYVSRVLLCFISFSILGVVWGNVFFDLKKAEESVKKGGESDKTIPVSMKIENVEPGMKIIAPIVAENGKTVLEESIRANRDNLLSLKKANVKNVNVEGKIPVNVKRSQ